MHPARAFDQHELRPVGLPHQGADTRRCCRCIGEDVGREPSLNRCLGKLRGVLANRHQSVRDGCKPGDIGPDLLVPQLADCSQFEHIAQDEDQALASLPNRVSGLERVPHGGRVCIIAIVQPGQLTGRHAERGETTGRALGGPQRCAGRLKVQTVLQHCGYGREGGGDAVGADERQLHLAALSQGVQFKTRPRSRHLNLRGPHLIGRLFAKGDNPTAGLLPDGGQQHRVVAIDNGHPVRRQGRKQLGFRGQHPCQVAERLGVFFANGRNDTNMGLGETAQRGELSGAARSHFQDQEVVLRRGAQQSQRQANVIIQIPLGRPGGSLGGKDLGHQLFGRCFAVAAGNANHPRGKPLAVPGGEVLEGGQRIGDGDPGSAIRLPDRESRRKKKAGRSALHRSRDIAVAIDPLAGERDEQRLGRDVARINADRGKQRVWTPPPERSSGSGTDVVRVECNSHNGPTLAGRPRRRKRGRVSGGIVPLIPALGSRPGLALSRQGRGRGPCASPFILSGASAKSKGEGPLPVVYQFEIRRLFSAGSSDPPLALKQGVRASSPQRIAAGMAALLLRWVRLLTRRAGAALPEEQGQGRPGRSCLSFTSSCPAAGVTPPTLALPLKGGGNQTPSPPEACPEPVEGERVGVRGNKQTEPLSIGGCSRRFLIVLLPMSQQEEQARTIVQTLRRHGHTAYFAGGCVRDRLLGVQAKDFDIATDARTAEIWKIFPQTIPVGAQFGVVLVVLEGVPYEVATFRADGAYRDGRHPVAVRFSTAREDALRRDFTINGMFFDPLTDTVIDYVGGQADLHNRIIRAIGEPAARFHEDRIRLLRAVRFAARLGFSIEPETWRAVRQFASTLTDMAWERIGDEVVKTLTEGSARPAVRLLAESGLLESILPEIMALRGVAQSPDFHPEGDVFVHTLLVLKQLDALHQPSETLALGALLHDVAKPRCRGQKGERVTFYGHCEQGADMAVDICQRLKRSRATWERVAFLVKNHLRLRDAPRMRPARLKRFLRQTGIAELLELARLDALGSNGDLEAYAFCRRQLSELGPEALSPPRLVSGRDLIQLGFQPGPRFATILNAVEEAQLEGRLRSRPAALAWVQQHWPLAGAARHTALTALGDASKRSSRPAAPAPSERSDPTGEE